MSPSPWKIWIDTGGTFTDCLATVSGQLKRLKILSNSIVRIKILEQTSPHSFIVQFPFVITKNFLNGFSFSIGKKTGTIIRVDTERSEVFLNTSYTRVHSTAEITTHEEVPVLAARILTETGLQESFPAMEIKLGSTRGTNALLEKKGAKTAFIVTKGFKDLMIIGDQQRPDLFALHVRKEKPLYDNVVEADERVSADGSVIRPLLDEEIQNIITLLWKRKVTSVAVAFLNSYKNPVHEQQLEKALRHAGFQFVSCSHRLSSQIKILPRAGTTIVNAYLDPIIHQYVERIRQGLNIPDFYIMSSAGGLLRASNFHPKDSLLSGPAGGVMGAIHKASLSGADKIISFDMGGTSTDVSLCNGRPDYRYECVVGDQKILSPSLAIETIAAGGGSICAFDGFRFTVGPQSAGASPGPACYGAGGPLTITDVNLLLGRLDADNFSIPVYEDHARMALKEFISSVNRASKKRLSEEEVLEALLGIANEKMAEAIRKVSIQRGHDAKEYTLLCFGGAGGQHTCALASMLNVSKVIVPYDAGLLSAYGIGHAQVEKTNEQLMLAPLQDVSLRIQEVMTRLFSRAKSDLIKDGFAADDIKTCKQFVFMRLRGQETSIEIEFHEGDDLRRKFISRYKKVYGHWIPHREIEVESVRVMVAVGDQTVSSSSKRATRYTPQPIKHKKIFSNGRWRHCPVYRWEKLARGAQIKGPSLLISDNSTLYIESGWEVKLDQHDNAILTAKEIVSRPQAELAEAKLELYINRFASIASEMGALLQRTSFSVNVKERLDFSCALLDAKGNLIVNAPHIPVHLGSLGVCVREVAKKISTHDGDVIITNHPAYGGSHLPDITLIRPIYVKKKLIGYAANRAHHAEVGGIKPGSMPADASCLEEEGVVITPMHLMKRGKPQWQEVESLFAHAAYPSRAIQENLADLNAALASLLYGEKALQELCSRYTVEEVTHYMKAIYDHAGQLMKKKMTMLPSSYFKAVEKLDDGSVLTVTITRTKNRLIVDFTGSADVHPGNLNATKAIVSSVLLYVLRILIDEPLPLNEGLLKQVSVIIPKGMLNPVFAKDHKHSPAVVGGNTEVSQRLTDTLLKALRLAACSQGTMNNFLFGNDRFGYYETICGGTGAVEGFNGTDAVHQHMTNTRITDPEILEYRYPVRLEEFSIRKGSGGKGKWKGGDGVIRKITFTDTVEVNILSQHRREKPYGMKGGKPGKPGQQYIIRSNGIRQQIQGISGATLHQGDSMVILTPGGGGWDQTSQMVTPSFNDANGSDPFGTNS